VGALLPPEEIHQPVGIRRTMATFAYISEE
jgi:hypothetical protein